MKLLIQVVLLAALSIASVHAECEDNCSSNGICLPGEKQDTCVCLPGMGGSSCEVDDCSAQNNCNGKGECFQGKCFCSPGYAGEDCSDTEGCGNDADCNNRGECKNGKCFCLPGFAGEDCNTEAKCEDDCNGRGVCDAANGFKCICGSGWVGATCDVLASSDPCDSDCGGGERGVCRDGECWCYPGYTGEGCEEEKKCPDDCSGHGICALHLDATCVCEPGYEGHACEEVTCPKGSNACNGHGQCALNECWCEPGWEGFDCLKRTKCPNNCNRHGSCIEGKCHCNQGFAGDDCLLPTAAHRKALRQKECLNDCSGHGVCAYGLIDTVGEPIAECECLLGWGGNDCSIDHSCKEQNYCSGHGSCAGDECVCDCGYGGEDCSKVTVGTDIECPGGCNGNGMCLLGVCYCDPGFSGDGCEIDNGCPADCNGHGDCHWGKCFCHPGYSGSDCMDEGCSGCSGHGFCCNNLCVCEPGYAGLECNEYALSTPLCPNQCSGHGVCEVIDGNTRCNCNTHFAGDDCSIFFLDDDLDTTGLRSGAQNFVGEKWDGDQPAGKGGAALAFLEETAEVLPRFLQEEEGAACPCEGGNGICLEAGVCTCNPGFAGETCAEEFVCLNGCSGNGICGNGKCYCRAGFDGEDCSGGPAATCAGLGEYVEGECFCAEGVLHPLCVGDVQIEDEEAEEPCPVAETNCSKCEEMAATLNVEESAASVLEFDVSTLAIIAFVACVSGFVSGLVIQQVSKARQRDIAKAIIMYNEEDDNDALDGLLNDDLFDLPAEVLNFAEEDSLDNWS